MFKRLLSARPNNRKTSAAKKIQEHAKTYLGRKSAFMYTHGYNKAIRSLIGNYPKMENKNENYKRAAVFRKSIIRSMKPINLRGGNSIIRGLSGKNANVVRKHIANGTPYNRNAFSSFTRNMHTAKRFSSRNKLILKIQNASVPAIRYNKSKNGHRSLYAEKEILLPPGRFILQKPPSINSNYTVYKVKFIPKNIKNINANTRTLAEAGKKKFPNKTSLGNHNNLHKNMNAKWATRHSTNVANQIIEIKNYIRREIGAESSSNYNLNDLKKFKTVIMNAEPKDSVQKIVKLSYIARNLYPEDVVIRKIINMIRSLPSENRSLLSKKFVQEIITYLWYILTDNEREHMVRVFGFKI